MADEWGPWIEHDGSPCPCVGMWVHRYHEYCSGMKMEKEGVVTRGGRSWTWAPGFSRVIRYRIRKPRALQQLIDMVENLPAPVKEAQDA